MITGIGIDLVDVRRFDVIDERETVNRQFLTSTEYETARRAAQPAQRWAEIFAGKEAVLKALGCGLDQLSRWQEIEIGPDLRPRLSGGLQELAAATGATRIHLSLARCFDHVMAYAMIETGIVAKAHKRDHQEVRA